MSKVEGFLAAVGIFAILFGVMIMGGATNPKADFTLSMVVGLILTVIGGWFVWRYRGRHRKW